MKIEIVKEVAGMQIGTIKDVPVLVANNLIERGLATEVKTNKEKAPKAK